MEIDADQAVYRRDTGDYHAACFDGLKTSGVAVKRFSGESVGCRLCSERITTGMVIVEVVDDCLTHVSCFFGTPNGRSRSLGACAATPSVVSAGRSLRERSEALRPRSRYLFRAFPLGWGRSEDQPAAPATGPLPAGVMPRRDAIRTSSATEPACIFAIT